MNPSPRPFLVMAIVLLALNVTSACAEQTLYDEKADGKTLIAEALEKAKAEDKRVLIVWGANWCGWCHLLDEAFRDDATVRELLTENYVLIRIDMGHRTKHMELAKEYECDFDQMPIAHSTILDQEGKPVGQMPHAKFLVGNGSSRRHNPKLIAEFLEDNKKKEEKIGNNVEGTPS